MKTFEIIQAASGLTPLHVICLLLGVIAYILDKYLEQFNKFKADGKYLAFKDFFKDPNTYVSGILTIILSFLATVGVIYEIPDHNTMTAVGGGVLSYGGYAFLRQRMKSSLYLKQSKMLNNEGPDNS
jgi:hypothetical protein